MSRFQWYRKHKRGYWIKYNKGWENVDIIEYATVVSFNTVLDLPDFEVEEWA